MINLLLAIARIAVEAALPTQVTVARLAVSTLRRGVLKRAVVARGRRAVRRGRRMGLVDAAVSGIRRGGAALEEAPSPPVRIIPPTPGGAAGEGGPLPLAPQERIPVPPGAYPHTPVPGNSYFQGSRFTQNILNSQFNVSPGPTPPPNKEPPTDDRLSKLVKADIAANVANVARNLANSWLPHIQWEGHVNATGFKTTPTRTVVHYALAVAFGLINQQRLSSVSLVVHVDYETNHVSVSYVSQAYWLTEIMTLGLYALTATVPPEIVRDSAAMQKRLLDNVSRSVQTGFRQGASAGVIELGNGLIQYGGDAVKLTLKAYQSMGRLLGPLGVYDMGADTLYGGRASALLRAPIQPEPFASMQTGPDGKPVPLLTRLPAPNPQPPVCLGTDPASGYSLDLRSLVTQALHDPGIVPPVPDTNVSLPPVF